MNPCKNWKEKIHLYLDGALDSKDTIEVKTHLSECRSCFSEYDYWKSIEATVRTYSDEECPSELKEKLYAIGSRNVMRNAIRAVAFVIVEIIRTSKRKFEIQPDALKRLQSNYNIPDWVLRWVFFV